MFNSRSKYLVPGFRPFSRRGGGASASHLSMSHANTTARSSRTYIRLPIRASSRSWIRPSGTGVAPSATPTIIIDGEVYTGDWRNTDDLRAAIVGEDAVWLADDVPATEPLPASVQLRAHGDPLGARVRRDGDTLHIELDTPTRGLAAGQSAVVYAGSRVLGQATIRSAHRRAA